MAAKKFVVTGEQHERFYKRRWELERQFREGNIDPDKTNEVLQWLLEGKPVQRDFTQQILAGCNAPPPVIKKSRFDMGPLVKWEVFWINYGIKVSVSDIGIPAKVKGFNRLLIIPKDLTIQKAYDLCSTKFACWKDTEKSLDQVVTQNDRDAKNGSYAIRVRDRREADEELRKMSADVLASKGIKGITLLERLVYELKYFDETGKHLDINSWTLCSGSRKKVGDMPKVRFNDGHVGVSDCHPGSCLGDLRVREVIALDQAA